MTYYLLSTYALSIALGTIFWFLLMKPVSRFLSPLLEETAKQSLGWILLIGSYLIPILCVVGPGVSYRWYGREPKLLEGYLTMVQGGIFSCGVAFAIFTAIILIIGIVQNAQVQTAKNLGRCKKTPPSTSNS